MNYDNITTTYTANIEEVARRIAEDFEDVEELEREAGAQQTGQPPACSFCKTKPPTTCRGEVATHPFHSITILRFISSRVAGHTYFTIYFITRSRSYLFYIPSHTSS